MSENNYTIREVTEKDDAKIARAIRSVLIEMGVPKVGTAYEDASLDCMTKTYDAPKRRYFVVARDNHIYGGAGISPLDNYSGNVCELQKMYFTEEIRAKGLGSKMMHKCLEFAKNVGFEQCYIETMPYMHNAQKLYKKTGFKTLDKPMGNTGHYSCTVWMLKDL